MSVAREPLEAWGSFRPRLSVGGTLVLLYWLGATLLAARAYELGFHRYQPRVRGADSEMLLTLARDAGLWGACATAATMGAPVNSGCRVAISMSSCTRRSLCGALYPLECRDCRKAQVEPGQRAPDAAP